MDLSVIRGSRGQGYRHRRGIERPAHRVIQEDRRNSVRGAIMNPKFPALLISALTLLTVLPASAAPSAAAKPGYEQEIAAWQKDRDKGLRDENGWLTLVGLF